MLYLKIIIDSYLSFKEHLPLGFPPDYSQEWIERAYSVIYGQYFFTSQVRFESYVRSKILSINPSTVFPDNVNILGLHQDFTSMTRAAWLQCGGDLTCYDQKLFSIWNTLSVKYGLSGGGPIASVDTHQYYNSMPKLIFMDSNLMFFMWLCLNE
jgi:hypothetical protein